MNSPQTKQHKDRLITLISGLFLVAALVVFGTQVNLDFERPSSSPAAVEAQTVVEGNQGVNFTLNVEPEPVTVDLTTNKGEVWTGEQFELSWTTEGTRELERQIDWSGQVPSANIESASQEMSESVAGEYTYQLEATGYGDSPQVETDDVQITVINPPGFSLSGHDVALDGVPGAMAEMELTLTSLHDYEGEVLLYISEMDPENEKDGNELIDFSFSPDDRPYIADTNDSSNPVTVDLNMQVQQPIRSDVEYKVTILGTDQSGNAATTNQDITIIINAEAFSPRTIDEF